MEFTAGKMDERVGDSIVRYQNLAPKHETTDQ